MCDAIKTPNNLPTVLSENMSILEDFLSIVLSSFQGFE